MQGWEVVEKPDTPALTRGELAKAGGINPETVRYYEKHGLLPMPARTASGYRQFTGTDVERIRFIKRAQRVGFSLDQIRMLLDLKFDAGATCGDVYAVTAAKLDEIEAKIAELETMKHTLQSLLADCPGGVRPIEECPILSDFTTPGSIPFVKIAK